MKFSSYPVVTSVAPDDTLLIHQDSSNAERQVSADNAAKSFAAWGTDETIASLRAVVVTSLVTGAKRIVGGYYAVGDGGGGPFYYDSGSTADDNGGTVIKPNAGSGRWLRPATNRLDVRWFGAVGDGSTNDTTAIQNTVDAAAELTESTVYFPAGVYKLTTQISLGAVPQVNITFLGDGPNVSILKQFGNNENGLNLQFQNVSADQPYRASILSLGFQTDGGGATGIIVSFGDPAITINHKNPALVMSNVNVVSTEDAKSWANGIDITSAWNCHLTDVFVSGSSQSGVWTNLAGDGIAMHGFCVNSHFSNVQAGFFLNGFHWSNGGLTNGFKTEGLFFSNCSFAQCRRGVYLQGVAGNRISTFNWQGGLIETRAGIAGIHLLNVQDFRIIGTMFVSEAVGTVVGVLADACERGIVANNEFSSMAIGFEATGASSAINVNNNNNIGTATQVKFGASCTYCISFRNTSWEFTNRKEVNLGNATNLIYHGCGYVCTVGRNQADNQVIADGVETDAEWQTTVNNDLPKSVGGAEMWTIGDPERVYIPDGVHWIRVRSGIRWQDLATPVPGNTGMRVAKVKFDNGNIIMASAIPTGNDAVAAAEGDFTLCSSKMNTTGRSYVYMTAQQTSGNNLALRGSSEANVSGGTYLEVEIIG